ncbi:hypothetical protein BU25DRAFT_71258 [Macroventuria anomochaeta]|uniref:Uncharacterized protein n=1 Tax=Macroventuria anomochaeta TaxID=301207 RepID=A0ACB6S140_9PLEO|nr:uncharacterized protein BU25DRAFT_71258 [Macroventuria anomochaeta]KAF2627222.1 hypothetical protein BU25DRAFT_71258 [Macroventuria anomochaeta]
MSFLLDPLLTSQPWSNLHHISCSRYNDFVLTQHCSRCGIQCCENCRAHIVYQTIWNRQADPVTERRRISNSVSQTRPWPVPKLCRLLHGNQVNQLAILQQHHRPENSAQVEDLQRLSRS